MRSILVHFNHHSVLSGMAVDSASGTHWGGYFIALAISLAWSTLVGVLGYEEQRPWGSFFLQYLWEFCLGMWIAERVVNGHWLKVIDGSGLKLWWLLAGAIGGMGLTGFMAWHGGILKLYNDIPSLMGYLSTMLLIFKVGVNVVNRFFVWASGFSYELYLMHYLVFCIMVFFFKNACSVILLISLSLVAAYITAYIYSLCVKRMKIK